MTAMSTLVPALMRELAIPGTFDDVFPDTLPADLMASLADGFGEAQLYGFFPDHAMTAILDDQDAPTGDWLVAPDISAAGAAIITIFTGMRIIRAQLRSLTSSERYKAGGAEMEIARSANVLRDELKFLRERLNDLVNQARRPVCGVAVFDNYFARGGGIATIGGFYAHEYQG